jgi:hypothetical protein
MDLLIYLQIIKDSCVAEPKSRVTGSNSDVIQFGFKFDIIILYAHNPYPFLLQMLSLDFRQRNQNSHCIFKTQILLLKKVR